MRPAHTSRKRCVIFEGLIRVHERLAFVGSSRLSVQSDQVAREQALRKVSENCGALPSSTYLTREAKRLGLHALCRRDQRHSRSHACGISDLPEPLQGQAGHHADGHGACHIDVGSKGPGNDDLIQFLLFPAVRRQKHLNPGSDRRLGKLQFPNVMLGEHDRHGRPGFPFSNQHEFPVLLAGSDPRMAVQHPAAPVHNPCEVELGHGIQHS